MGCNIARSRIVKNISCSVLAQVISLIVAFVLNMLVPKLINEYEYTYWQVYVLYANYVGVLHFGLLDGFILRYSQFDYDNLDKGILRTQFIILVLADTLCAIIVFFSAVFILSDEYSLIGVFVAIAIIVKNVVNFVNLSFQITNRIKEYAFVSIIQKITYAFFVFVALISDVKEFYWICICELLGEFAAFFWSIKYNKEIYFGKLLKFSSIKNEIKNNIIAGSFLLLSNWSAMFLIGITRIIVQYRWDELTFGKVALSFNVTGLFLVFVSAVSIVLFPTLKRMKEEYLPAFYSKARKTLSLILIFALIFYFPGSWLLAKWLPQYHESIIYLGILMPIIIYRSKVSLLTNNYLKAYRKEKLLLKINLTSVAVATFGSVMIANMFKSITLLLLFTVIIMMCMSVWAEFEVSKIIKEAFVLESLVEFLLTIIFILCARYMSMTKGLVVYSSFAIVYLLFNYLKLRNEVNK